MLSRIIVRLWLSAMLTLPLVGAGWVGAWAQNINEPEVQKGQTKLETFSVFQSGFNAGAADDARELHNLSYYRGVTDFWQIKAFLALERPLHEGYRAAAAVLENTFELQNAKKAGGLGLAWFTGLAVSLDDEVTNAVVFGPIVRVGAGPTSLILNPFLEQTFGRNREEGIAFVYGWQLKHQLRQGFWLGVEGFGTLPDIGGNGNGDQPERHRIGPLLSFEWEVAPQRTLSFEVGMLFGLTEATPDQNIKFQITYTMN